MPPPSLLQLCTVTAMRNVKYLNDIGNIPYALARPFLLKVESPEKLRSLEQQSPHLMRDDEELWLEFIKRDIPKWDEYDLPERPDCWYDVYCDLREQVQRAVDEDAEKLKMALDGISSERQKHSAKFVTDRRIIGLPRERPTAKQRYASFDRRMGGFAPKKNSIFTATRRNPALAVPTKHLNNRATQVRQAPISLIEEHRRPPESAPPWRKDAPALRAPGRSRSQAQHDPAVNPTLRDNEARLRALTSGRPTISHSSSSAGFNRPPSGPIAAPRRAPPPRDTSEARSQPRMQPSGGSAAGSALEEPASTAQPPRPPMTRKRPAPSLFIQPKKKKVN
ncbi:RNA polymerase II transcription factor SIII subunit A [Aspergillus ellipticus CBS 707.79]|uniref:RNA polymerase II transcription factor SIII subunit A n=1 Tax=Aspergillus ellipticus CBS 707.79 TaxID=1448320 RepID=A0A319DEA5_9EURO|nr:RNA polymerase II transcription factor SIII subunit A [Aspergillus ellipticus CBS 707.79]